MSRELKIELFSEETHHFVNFRYENLNCLVLNILRCLLRSILCCACYKIFGVKFCFRETCMMLLFTISVRLRVDPLIATESATASSLEQLPLYFFFKITGLIKLDCFDRSVYSKCALHNKTWLKFQKAFCLFLQ